MMLTDKQFYKAALDLSIPQMKEARDLFFEGKKAEAEKVFAMTSDGRYQLKGRLYQIEDMLSDNFIKINQSCVANIKMIKRFDASISGQLTVYFQNGYRDYVSRRNIKAVKQKFGL